MKPFLKISFNLGAGMHDPDDDGADLVGEYRKNLRAFGNVLYDFAPGVTFGLELDH